MPVSVEIHPQKESSFLGLLPAVNENLKGSLISSLKDFKGRWLLVRIGSSTCDDICRQELYVMRQVRLMTGKNRARVERIWLIDNDLSLTKASNQEEFEGTWGLRLSNNIDFLRSLELTSKDFDKNFNYKGLWLIDPQGHFMMRYPPNPDIKKIHKDLTRLLKVSRTG